MVATEPQALDASCVELHTPLDAVLANERATQVRGGLARLGELDRHTLEAFYVRGQSLSEMSESFAAPIGTINAGCTWPESGSRGSWKRRRPCEVMLSSLPQGRLSGSSLGCPFFLF